MTRSELGEHLMRPRSTLYYQVRKAVDLKFLAEEKRGGKRWLRRGSRPLPEDKPPLPAVEEVEGFFFGVPAPRATECWKDFISDLAASGPQGVTAAEWAARVEQPVDMIRRRLDVLVEAGTLTYDSQTERYALRVTVEPA